MKKINLYLKDLGLTDIESSIYLNLLRNGPSTILEVSRRTGLNRITAHVNSQNLIKKGLLSSIKKGSKRFIIAEAPAKLESLIRNEEINIERKRDLLPGVLELLKNEASASRNSKTHFDVRTYEGKDAINYLYEEILKSKELRAFVNAEEINRIYPQNFKRFSEAAKKGSIEIWDVVENNSFGQLQVKKNNFGNYHMKILPKGVEIGSMDYLIHDNKITIIEGDEEPVGVVISSSALYSNSKALFDAMWGLL